MAYVRIAAVTSAGITPMFPLKPSERARPCVATGASSARDVAPSSAIDAVDVVFQLSRGGRDVLGAVYALDKEQLQEFLRITADLLRQGVVGTEVLNVRGEPYVSYLPERVADPKLRDAPPWRDRRSIHLPLPLPHLDIRV